MRERTFVRHCVIAGVLLGVGGCATTPTAPAEVMPIAGPGRQVLRIATVTWTHSGSTSDFPGTRTSFSVEALPGVLCVARNARGTAEAVTPGWLDVGIGEGSGTLRIECSREGYGTERTEFACITPRTRSSMHGAMAGLQLVGALGPAAVVAAPAVVVAALVGAPLLGATVGSTVAGPDPDVCNYTERGIIAVTMSRR